MPPKQPQQPPRVAILGAGLGGLVLALALEHHLGIHADLYEQAPSFDSNAGGAIGLYPNGLRVLRDISPQLLADVQAAACPYIYRRWMRHDGTEVACAEESYLCPADYPHLTSIGIRRWRLQKVLCDAAAARGLHITFGRRVRQVVVQQQPVDETSGSATLYSVLFEGDADVARDYVAVFGADGVKSKTREFIHGTGADASAVYTGITCLMGAAQLPRPVRGICFPSSATTKCHACFYPTRLPSGSDSDDPPEQVFQIFFPTAERPETWGTLSAADAKRECAQLADKLESDGWHADFIAPIRAAETVLRVGLRAREPLDSWASGRVVLLGDAAHPPVPYIGQGAMMAFEDAGVLALLLKHYCRPSDNSSSSSSVDFAGRNFDRAVQLYQQMRIPRARAILGASHKLGATQQLRADSWLYNWAREWWIWLQVKWYGTLPIMRPGAAYDYAAAVRSAIQSNGD